MPSYYKQVLNGATATGVGTTIMFDSPRAWISNIVSFQVSFTGAPSDVEVHLEGTLDGTAWWMLATWHSPESNGLLINPNIPPIIGIRGNLITLTGGASPTVNAWVALGASGVVNGTNV